jgi:circadian clock protein KaiB
MRELNLKPKSEAKNSSTRSRKSLASKKMYRLRLYVTGQTPRSASSLQNLKDVCDEYLAGRFELDVVDIYQQPELAREAQIIAAPTLIKMLPLPLRKLVGDLSNRKQVMIGLDIKDEKA